MKNEFLNIHPDFSLNGKHYDAASLLDLAEALHNMGDDEEKEIASFLLEWLYPKDTLLVKTSGSTGNPKTITLQKEKMIASARATGQFFDLPSKTTALHCLPLQYIAGKMMLVRAMMLGWHLDVVTPTKSPLKQTSKTYDFVAMVPYQLAHSFEELNQIKTLIVGGGEVSQELQSQLQEYNTKVYATYGMTETITHVAIKKLNHLPSLEKKLYNALPGITFSTDTRNCLIINAPSIVDEPLTTNDVVHCISKTEFEWLGRFDNIINSGGVKINPEVLEQRLQKHINVPFFIASLPDTKLSEKIVLCIENHQQDLPKNTFDNWDTYEIPKDIYTLPKFVYTKTGKLQRKKTLALL